MMSQNPRQVLARLVESLQTLQLATLAADGLPALSYAPFSRAADGDFVIFISRLASHTDNLLRTPHASILLIADERDSRQPFARQRVNYRCQARQVPRDAVDYVPLLDGLQAKFGETVSLLRSLDDFLLFRLSPQYGRLIIGFGAAYELDHEQRIHPVGPKDRSIEATGFSEKS